MIVLGIDPGPKDSAYLLWEPNTILAAGIEPNETLLRMLQFNEICDLKASDVVGIEMIASFGMPVGRETFETVLWVGRFYERCRPEPRLVYRSEVKLHHCQSMRAKDANVSQALRDKYGEKGTKANPGITYGLRSHLWSAFAVATFISETSTNPRSASLKVEDAPRTGEIAGAPPACASVS